MPEVTKGEISGDQLKKHQGNLGPLLSGSDISFRSHVLFLDSYISIILQYRLQSHFPSSPTNKLSPQAPHITLRLLHYFAPLLPLI